MAKVDDNIITEGLSGRLGKKLVFRKGRAGTTIVSIRAKFSGDREFTEDQLSHQELFKTAIAYAKKAKSQPIYKKLARGTESNSFNVAVADWFSQPQVMDIDPTQWTGEVGQIIRIQAQDEVMLATVSVLIQDANGNILEQGEAVPFEDLWWYYTTTSQLAQSSTLQVVATAQDLPGSQSASLGTIPTNNTILPSPVFLMRCWFPAGTQITFPGLIC